MDMDEDLDTHICLKCQRTILGLDKYVAHKRHECPVLLAFRANGPTEAPGILRPPLPDGSETIPSAVVGVDDAAKLSICPTVDSTGVHTARLEDAFFLSLELQSANRHPTSHLGGRNPNGDHASTEDTSGAPIALMPYTSDDVALLQHQMESDTFKVAADAFKVAADPFYDSEEEEAEDVVVPEDDEDEDSVIGRPPRGHTGGKWRPASVAETSPPPRDIATSQSADQESAMTSGGSDRVHRYNTRRADSRLVNCLRCLNTHSAFSRHCTAYPVDKNKKGLKVCQPCGGVSFPSAAALVEHLSSPVHWQRGSLHPLHESLILCNAAALAPLAPFRCALCRFYFNEPGNLLDHWSNPRPEHESCVAVGRLFTCGHCSNTFLQPADVVRHLVEVLASLDHKGQVRLTPLVTDARPFVRCARCPWQGESTRALAVHVGLKHGSANPKGGHDRIAGPATRRRTLMNGLLFKCPECKFSTTTRLQIKVHRRKVHQSSKGVDADSSCGESSGNDWSPPKAAESECSGSEMSEGESKVVDKSRLHCRECDSVFGGRAALQEHMEAIHPASLFRCEACCLSFLRRTALVFHKRSLLHCCYEIGFRQSTSPDNGPILRCGLCSFVTASEAGFAFHKAIHVGPVSQIGSADAPTESLPGDGSDLIESQCKPVVAVGWSSKLKPGKKKKLASSAPMYRCPECNNVFGCYALRVHLGTEHWNECPFSCLNCQLVFATSEALEAHNRSRHQARNLQCPQCPFHTHRHSRLQIHMEQHGERQHKFLCDTCAARFNSSACLRAHIRKHFKERTHKCTVKGCMRAFRYIHELTEHSRVHTEERPFLCHDCGYTAKTQSQLSKHRRRHTGEKPFPCPHCTYRAALSAQLRRHLLVHSGAKPYSCPYCTYTCNTQENLRKHVLKSKKHVGLHVYRCPHCDFGCDWAEEMRGHLIERHGNTLTAHEDEAPAFASRATGVYNMKAGPGLSKVLRIEYVPRTRKRKTEVSCSSEGENPAIAVEEPIRMSNSADGLDVIEALDSEAFPVGARSVTVALPDSSDIFRFVHDQQEEILLTIEVPTSVVTGGEIDAEKLCLSEVEGVGQFAGGQTLAIVDNDSTVPGEGSTYFLYTISS